jgi:hypothetical protein
MQIIQAAAAAGIPSSIALAVAQQESSFNPDARGAAGEVGVFQLLPSSFPGQAIGDPNTNISLGVGYLASLYQQFGDWATALAAYNAGPGNVSKGIIPKSTQSYVSSVLGTAGAGDSGAAAGPLVVDDSTDVLSSDMAALEPAGIDPSLVAPLIVLGIGALAWAIWG